MSNLTLFAAAAFVLALLLSARGAPLMFWLAFRCAQLEALILLRKFLNLLLERWYRFLDEDLVFLHYRTRHWTRFLSRGCHRPPPVVGRRPFVNISDRP